MKNIKSFFKKLDNNLIFILTAFLVVFIPLYPKLPLANLIEGYIVRLRLEDIFIFLTFVIWLIQLARKKVKLVKNKFSNFVIAYIIFGFLSCLSALFLTKTVPFIRSHVLKLFFHWVRRIEYFSLFFITYSAIDSKRKLKLFLKIATLSLVGVIVYGFGQKYLYWPAFSTMNREFSKGIALYLRPNTRLMSTFAGQYDLAAYTMIALSLIIPTIWLSKKSWKKFFFYLLFLTTYWTLILTVSRASFLSYLGALFFLSIFLLREKTLFWVFKKLTLVLLFSFFVMFFFGDLAERFIHLIPNQNIKEQVIIAQKSLNQPFRQRPESDFTRGDLPELLAFLYNKKKEAPTPDKKKETPPSDSSKLSGIDQVTSLSDMPPSTTKSVEKEAETPIPPDVSREEEKIRREQQKKEDNVGENEPGYSPNALKYGLSAAIRLDALWPRAWSSFKKNPLLGTGYSTLVKSQNTEFTYAESTDNDYLRMLGETGILGTITFLALPYLLLSVSIKNLSKTKEKFHKIILLGSIASTIGLLINAFYIDIFESSKIAYTFWMLTAIVYRSVELQKENA